MNKKQSKQGLARVWPALGAMAIVAAGLTGGAGAWAAEPATPAKPPDAPAVASDETVVLDDTMMWRIYRVEGPQHIREKDGKLLAGYVSGRPGYEGGLDSREARTCWHTQQQHPPGGDASTSGFCGKPSILPPAGWANLAMDDGAWPRFRLPQPVSFAESSNNQMLNLGGEVNDTALILARARFEVKDPARVKACRLSLSYWGGVVVYVNGQEVARGSLAGQPADWGDPAEDYPEEVFLAPGGKPLRSDDEKNPDRLEKRNRRLTDVTIPAAALRPGVNVIAIEAHPAPINAKVLRREVVHGHLIKGVAWPTVGLLSARLTVSPAGVVPTLREVGTPRPGGVQVWNAPTSDKVSVFDFGNPLDPLQPLVIRAARNTVFSSRLMVGSDQPIRGLKVSVGDLAWHSQSSSSSAKRSSSSADRIEDEDEDDDEDGRQDKSRQVGGVSAQSTQAPTNAKIPSAAIRVRYAVAATPDKTWLSPADFDGLFDAIPAEIQASTAAADLERYRAYGNPWSGAKRLFHYVTDRPMMAARPVAPLWFTVKVPRDVPAGVYEGLVSISAEGLAEVKVPLRVHVSAWTAPDVRNYRIQNYLFQSEESVGHYYGVPPYSDKHLELVGKSLALAAELNHFHVEANLVIEYQGPGSNPESLVRWIKQSDGTFKHDFTNFDRYLDMVAKAIGRPRVLTLNHLTGGGKVTCLDPTTGKLEALQEPGEMADRYAFWKPVYDEIVKRLKARGWLEQTTLGAQAQQAFLLDPRDVYMGNKLWPGAEWSFTSHDGVPMELVGAAPADPKASLDMARIQAAVRILKEGRQADPELQAAGLTADRINWAPVRHSDYCTSRGRPFAPRPLYLGPRRNVTVFCPRVALSGCGENLPEVRRLVEAVILQKNVDGMGEQGVDLFPLKTKVGGYGFSPARAGNWWPNWDPYMRALLYPGPDGPVATERFEMFREGLQLSEVILFLQRAVAEKKVSPELQQRAAAVLAERPRYESWAFNNFYYRCFQSAADAKLLDMADEVTRDLPFAADTPASELAALVERVAASPTAAANRQQVRRLRTVTSALTPAQLGRLYACLKNEPKARFELPELVAVLGRAFGERCGGDAGKLGQLLGDTDALPFLRGYVQAVDESTNATLKTWALTDGAILLPLVNGLRAQYYYDGERWGDKDLAAERLVGSITAPTTDQKIGSPGGVTCRGDDRMQISARWTGFVEVRKPGVYTFHALADDGARLWVDNTLLIENYKNDDGATIELTAGLHPFKVEYWKISGRCSIAVTWSGPGFARQPIGAEVLRTSWTEQKK